jgi:alpha-L-arabinofuranosidase
MARPPCAWTWWAAMAPCWRRAGWRVSDPDWKKYSTTLTAAATDPKARMNVVLEGKGTLDLDFVSLFPETTFKNRPGGLRADMAQMLADLHPGFLRFPGGCIVEGSQLDRRYQWKTTIGPVEERKLIINRWNYEFAHKPTPDYFQSFGLGFYEYFQLCEDIGASPLPILNCGMACQFNTGQLVRMWDLDPYIQDMLDLVEFANGPVTSEWGAKRAAMGHPAPFNLKMIGVGNEQWGGQYLERYEAFVHVMKDKHPEISLVTDAGPSPSDDRFDFLWPKLVDLHADIVDQHCYARPIWFLNSTHRYDDYDRNGPKIFMGEYAAQSVDIVSTNNRNNLECALSEAAYMTGLERNAEVVRMASYAPLFAHVAGWQWTPNLIWVDNLRVYGTPNYYVQQLFSLNRGDDVLPVKLDTGKPPTPVPSGGIILSTLGSSAEFKDVRVTRPGATLYMDSFAYGTAGWTTTGGKWSVQDGAYRQADKNAAAFARIGDATWQDYTLTLKARKLDGLEGISIAVRNQEPGTEVQWNLGDTGNTEHRIKSYLGVQEQVVDIAPGRLENGQWYDVKMEMNGPRVTCYLDGKKVQSAVVPIPQTQPLYASAAWDETNGEVIVKVVNPADAVRAEIALAGVKQVGPTAKAIVLAGAQADENSLDDPHHIVPVEKPFTLDGSKFTYDFPQYSMTVLRIKAQ